MEETSEVNNVIKTENTIEIEPPAHVENKGFQGNRRGGGRGGGNRFGGRGHPGNRGGDRDGNPHRNDNDFRGRRGGGGGGGGGRGGFRGGPGHRQDDQGPDSGNGSSSGNLDGIPRGRMNIDRIQEKINAIQGPTYELPPIETGERKFNGRNRLYIGNISADVTEQELTEVFQQHGETAELFVNKEKNFGFIKMDYRTNAEKAKRELDGFLLKGRNLKIRFAPNSASVRVKNLSNYVTNELLYHAFSAFGEIEKVHVSVDDRGKSLGEGVVHFVKKFSAMNAIKKCKDACYFLTASLQPVIAEPYETVDDADGFLERNLNKKNTEFMQEREVAPRLCLPGSFEYEYGQKWKALYELNQQKEEALKKEMKLEKEKLFAQMTYAKYEHETEMLRNQLRARELDKERQKREWEKMERMAEEERLRQDDVMRRSQQEMESRMMPNADEMRRRQENNLFLQTHNLDNILEQQEQNYDQKANFGADGSPHIGVDMEPKQFMSSYERHNRYDGRDAQNRGNNSHGGRGHWVSDNRRDDYQLKRRRF